MTNAPTPAPLPESTATFLEDLDHAARAAVLERDRTEVVLRGLTAPPRDTPGPSVAAQRRATTWLHLRQHERAGQQHNAALDEVEQVTRWYLNVAETVLRAVVAGGPIPTGDQLNAQAVAHTEAESDTKGSPLLRPPQLTGLLTGVEDIDHAITTAHAALPPGEAINIRSAPASALTFARAMSAAAVRGARLASSADSMIWTAEQQQLR